MARAELPELLTFLCTLSFLKISVASKRCWFSKILPAVSTLLHAVVGLPYFLPFQANRGRFKIRATQYPLIRKRNVRKAWTAASGMMYVLRRLQRSIGLM
jgi:hypothetical protein